MNSSLTLQLVTHLRTFTNVHFVCKLSMSQNVKLHIFQQSHTPSVRLTISYFCSVTIYDMLASFTALVYTDKQLLIITTLLANEIHS